MLWLSFAGAVIDWGWVFLYGGGVEALGVAVVVIALVLALVAGRWGVTKPST